MGLHKLCIIPRQVLTSADLMTVLLLSHVRKYVHHS